MPGPPLVEWTSRWLGRPSIRMMSFTTWSGWPLRPVTVGGK